MRRGFIGWPWASAFAERARQSERDGAPDTIRAIVGASAPVPVLTTKEQITEMFGVAERNWDGSPANASAAAHDAIDKTGKVPSILIFTPRGAVPVPPNEETDE